MHHPSPKCCHSERQITHGCASPENYLQGTGVQKCYILQPTLTDTGYKSLPPPQSETTPWCQLCPRAPCRIGLRLYLYLATSPVLSCIPHLPSSFLQRPFLINHPSQALLLKNSTPDNYYHNYYVDLLFL